MTGLDAAHDHVVEVCIERWVGSTRVGSLVSLVMPPARVGGASHVHGLDAKALASAPPFAELAPRVVELLSGAVIVAHGARWDVSFLEAELLRAGRPTQFPSISTRLCSPDARLPSGATPYSPGEGAGHLPRRGAPGRGRRGGPPGALSPVHPGACPGQRARPLAGSHRREASPRGHSCGMRRSRGAPRRGCSDLSGRSTST